MKFILALFFLIPSVLYAHDTVTVANVNELLGAIQSDRTILIKPGVYQMREAEQMKVIEPGAEVHDVKITDHLMYSSGWGITLKDIKNISLIGLGKTPSDNRLVTSDLGDWIFTFKDCKNVTLKNLEAEHDPATEGGCVGGVWFFYTCKNVKVDHNRLLGSGRIGIEALEVTNLFVTNTDITECSEGILSFRTSTNAIFKDCRFFKNTSEYAFIDLDEATNVRFENCKIDYNTSNQVNDQYSKYNKFFRLYGVENLVFKGCSIKGNSARYLTSDAESVLLLKGLKLKKNEFEERYPAKIKKQ